MSRKATFPKKKILYICGSLNQTTINYQIYQELQEYDSWFSPFYDDGFIGLITKTGFLNFSILAGNAKRSTLKFLKQRNCQIDYKGKLNDYDLIVTCSDLIVPKNIKGKNIILVQEGMTDPEDYRYHLTKNLKLPRFIANTSMAGLSDAYQKFCIISEGYREIFTKKGVNPEKLEVTGIPNFDNVKQYEKNDFPHKDYVLAASSHMRETMKYENRKAFIEKAVKIANGDKLIFKLHPNEKRERAFREIEKYAPGSLIFQEGNTNHMIANCHTMLTRYSTVIMVALAMGKKVYSDLSQELQEKITPLQTGGKSAERIANVCREYLK